MELIKLIPSFFMTDFPGSSDPNLPPTIGGNGNGELNQPSVEGAAFVPPVPPVESVPVQPVNRLDQAYSVGAELIGQAEVVAEEGVKLGVAKEKVKANVEASSKVKTLAIDVLDSLQKRMDTLATNRQASASAAEARHLELQAQILGEAQLRGMAGAEVLRQQKVEALRQEMYGVDPRLAGVVEVKPGKVSEKKQSLWEAFQSGRRKAENARKIAEQTVNSAVAGIARTAADGLSDLVGKMRGQEQGRSAAVTQGLTGAQQSYDQAYGAQQSTATKLAGI